MRTAPILFAVLAAMSMPAAASELPASDDRLTVGQRVKVEGVSREGGFEARSVTLRDATTTVKIEGPVSSAERHGRRLAVLNFVIEVDPSTRLFRGTAPVSNRSALREGAWIEVKGRWKDEVLRATRIRIKEGPEGTAEIEGDIQTVDPQTSSVVILGRRVTVGTAAAILDERTSGAHPDHVERLRRDDDDSVDRAPITFSRVVLGGRAESALVGANNFDLGSQGRDVALPSRLQLLASAEVAPHIEAYSKLSLSQSFEGSLSGGVRLSEAYLTFSELGDLPLSLRVGRQRFRDHREWLFDEYLDAARVELTLPALTLEAAIISGVFGGSHQTRARRDQRQLVGSLKTRIAGTTLALYAMARDDRARHERPIWLSAAIDGRLARDWSYWTDAAVRRGTSASASLAGWAIDGGVRHRWPVRWSPTVTMSYARGSGDASSGDGVDGRFRQTDLEDNQAYFGGLRRVAIYGELFAPELSNLQVYTAGIGIKPAPAIALEAIYHRFVQAVTSTALPSSHLSGTLTGVRPDLGDELNAVFTLRLPSGISFDMVFGAFFPGAAIRPPVRPAFMWRPQVRFSF